MAEARFHRRFAEEAEGAGALSVASQRTSRGRVQATRDSIAVEAPVALVFNGVSHAVMMATPVELEAFGLGFALAEGVIDSPAQCHDIEVEAVHAGWEVRVTIAAQAFVALKQRRRAMEGRSGCGLCGVESLAAVDIDPSPMPLSQRLTSLGSRQVLKAMSRLTSLQPLNARTGACHAAAWAQPDGELLMAAEDVGRHNALDKLIGRIAACGQLRRRGFVVVSSRASYELVRKCARVGIPALAAISAPTSLAVDVAQRAGMRLFGFCRADQAVDYTAGLQLLERPG